MNGSFRCAFLVLTVLGLAFGGCVSSPDHGAEGEVLTARALDGTWSLLALNGEPVRVANGQRAPTLELKHDHQRVAGFAGVNQFAGTYAANGANLTFSALLATKMAGPPPLNDLETNYLRALESVTSWRIVRRELELLAGERVVARFAARERE